MCITQLRDTWLGKEALLQLCPSEGRKHTVGSDTFTDVWCMCYRSHGLSPPEGHVVGYPTHPALYSSHYGSVTILPDMWMFKIRKKLCEETESYSKMKSNYLYMNACWETFLPSSFSFHSWKISWKYKSCRNQNP